MRPSPLMAERNKAQHAARCGSALSESSLGSVLNIIHEEALAEFPGMRARRLAEQ
jgi:hypothetical protein